MGKLSFLSWPCLDRRGPLYLLADFIVPNQDYKTGAIIFTYFKKLFNKLLRLIKYFYNDFIFSIIADLVFCQFSAAQHGDPVTHEAYQVLNAMPNPGDTRMNYTQSLTSESS